MAASGSSRVRLASAWWLLALLPVFLLGQRHVLWGADEPREAEITRELYASGDWVVPRLNGVPFLEKPPLAHWAAATVFHVLGGLSEEWCRAPAALWGILISLACFWMGGMLFGRRVGVLAAFVLATSQEFVIQTHTLLVDPPMAAGVAWAFALFWRGYTSGSPRRRALFHVLGAAACGVAFLGKGPIGLVLPAVGVLVFLAWRKERRKALQLLAPANLVLFAVLTAPWLAMVRWRGGSAVFRTFFWDNMVMRFFSGSADHAAPPWDYAFGIFAVMVPWAVFVPPVIFALARPGGLETTESRRSWQYLVSIMGGPLVLLSMASAKRPGYLLPLMPAFAVSIAAWLDGALQEVEAGWMRVWRAVGTVALALAAVAAWGASGYLAMKAHAGLVVSGVGVMAALAGAVALGLSLRRERQQRLPVMVAGLALLTVFSLFSPSTFAALDARRGYDPLNAAIIEVAPPGTPLIGFDMGERELGLVDFLRQEATPQIASPQGLREVLRQRGTVVLVSVKAMTRLQAQNEWPETAEVVAAPRMRNRPYVLVRGRHSLERQPLPGRGSD